MVSNRRKSPVKETKVQNTRTRKSKNSKAAKEPEAATGEKSRFKQTTLTESFGMKSIYKRLRPRRDAKNYLEKSETSMLLQKHISPAKRDSFVLVERIRVPEGMGNKTPVYKNLRLSEDKKKEDSKIYEFNFDANDPSEKLTRKKKRRVAKKPAVKKTTKKPQVKAIPKTAKEKNAKVPAGLVKDEKNSKDNRVLKEKQLSSSPCPEVVHWAPDPEEDEIVQRSIIPKDPVPKQSAVPLRTPLTDNAQNISPKPKVISMATLEGSQKINVQPRSTANSDNFHPFRATNVFKSLQVGQQKKMMDHSLLNGNFSPIKRILDENFKPESPWRLPTLDTFSQIKQVYQSTPQVKKQSSFFGRITAGIDTKRKTSTLGGKMKNIDDENNENINVNVQKRRGKGSPLKKSVLGSVGECESEIISKAKSPAKVKAKPMQALIREPVAGTSRSSGTVLSATPDFSDFDDSAENKENAEPNIQTPRKSPSKQTRPLSEKNKQIFEPVPGPSGLQKKILEPVPGPSGFQTNRALTELKPVKQSNLNNFLNLEEMPQNTFINTSHGMFADVPPTPQSTKRLKKVKKEANVENAFGFDDNSSSNESSLIGTNKSVASPGRRILKPLRRNGNELLRHKIKSLAKPARLSVGEIKKTLLPAVLKDKKSQQEGLLPELEEKAAQREAGKVEKSQEVKNLVSFYDTFDLMSGDEYSALEEHTPQLPLFADLQPAHFSKPPKCSYGGKRVAKRSFSEEEDEDDVETKKFAAKKKKSSKTNRKVEKKLDEWAKNINDTFQEIDEFNLVVERLSSSH